MQKIEHHSKGFSEILREIIFGMEDGMVSTLGAITGIATGTSDHFIVLLSGLVVISVESISMGVGSYLSSKSEREMNEHKLHEEKKEISESPQSEIEELSEMYVQDGWPEDLAATMSHTASKNHKLFLQEMAFRELKLIPDELGNPLRNGIAMLFAYIVGGLIPLLPYMFTKTISTSLSISITITLAGLFFLGVATTKFTRRRWWVAGLEMLALASAAALIGYTIGKMADSFLTR